MRKTITLGLGILFFLVFMIPARYIYVCKIQHNCGEELVSQKKARSFSLTLMDGDSVILKGYEQLSFEKGSISPELTLNNQAFLEKVAAYIKATPEKNLTITGFFRASEQGISAGIFENLGLARSNALRDLLIKRGIDVGRISLDHSLVPNDDIVEAAKFELYEQRPAEYGEEGGLVKAQFRFDDMTFSDANFEFNSAVFKPGVALQTWADSVQIFFELNTDKSFRIIGHTDNIGTIQYNADLGLRRAQSAKSFFVERGVSVSIKTATRGEKEPIASNITELGRQKNRRVNFVIE